MKSIIIYSSKYGTTKQYAEWISEKTGIQLTNVSEDSHIQLPDTDFVVLGSPVYIGKLRISEWLQKHKRALLNKKIFLFIVCGTNPEEKDRLQSFIDASIPAEIKNQCEIFFFKGRIRYNELSFWDKLLVKMGASIAKSTEEKAMLRGFDLVDENCTLPFVKSIENYKSIKRGVSPLH